MALAFHMADRSDWQSVNAQNAMNANLNGCDDQSPFILTYTNWWHCGSDSMDCYNHITNRVLYYVHGEKCAQSTCLSTNAPGYEEKLRQTISNAIQAQKESVVESRSNRTCPYTWPTEMDYAANIILQKSQRCQFDYSTLYVLYEMVEKLFSLEEKCIQSGLIINSANSTTAEVALEGETLGELVSGYEARTQTILSLEPSITPTQSAERTKLTHTRIDTSTISLRSPKTRVKLRMKGDE